jgi:tetratricopeptide (TPR) repeat protein
MIKVKLLPVLAILFYSSIYTQEISGIENDRVTNSLVILSNLNKELNYSENNFDKQKFYSTLNNIDLLCSGIITDTVHKDINEIIRLTEETHNLSRLFPALTLQLEEYLSEIVISEFRFRTIVAVQHSLDFLHRNLPDLEKLTSSAEFATFNHELGAVKTRLVNRQIQILSLTADEIEKLRCWTALERMLNEIDIPQSESGSQFVQRSPYGLIINPGVILSRLSELNEGETKKEVKEYSGNVLMKIKTASPKYKENEDTIFYESLTPGLSKEKKPAMEALLYFNKAFLSENNEERISLYGKATENDSTFTAAFNNRGICYYIVGEYLKAIEDFKKVLILDTYYTSIYTNLGLCYYQLKDYKESINQFTLALQVGEKELIIFMTRGMCFQKLNNYNEAINDYAKAIEIDSSSYAAYSNRAECYKHLKKSNEVICDYKKLIELNPKNSTLYYNLGCIYFNQKDWKQSVKYWEQGLKVNPNDPNILSNLPKVKKYLMEKK